MFPVMTHSLSARQPTATRHLPVARGRERRESASETRVRTAPPSEPRLQVAVVRKDLGSDPYADVPCTD
jgi:hypothetical protein